MGKIALGVGLAVLGAVLRYWINSEISALIGFLCALVLIAWGTIEQAAESRQREGVLSITAGAFVPEQPATSRKPLILSFDINDPSCRQQQGVAAIPHHLFRLRVSNDNHSTNHNVRVVLEHVSFLFKLQGVELQVRHHQGASRIDIAGCGKEYFDLLEYNSYDIGTNQPVLHICHVVTSVEKSIPVDDYQFTAKAYSEEGVSNSVVLSFSRTSRESYQLVESVSA